KNKASSWNCAASLAPKENTYESPRSAALHTERARFHIRYRWHIGSGRPESERLSAFARRDRNCRVAKRTQYPVCCLYQWFDQDTSRTIRGPTKRGHSGGWAPGTHSASGSRFAFQKQRL